MAKENPKGTTSTGVPEVVRGDPLTAGTKVRGLYITDKLIKTYGTTTGCPKCEGFGTTHSAECRQRIEKATIESGEAFELKGAIAGGSTDVPFVAGRAGASGAGPATPRVAIGAGLLTPRPMGHGGDLGTPIPGTPAPGTPMPLPMDLSSVLIAAISLTEEPKVELWSDRKAWFGQKFPREAQEKGRQKELDNLVMFDAIEDTTIEDGDPLYDMV